MARKAQLKKSLSSEGEKAKFPFKPLIYPALLILSFLVIYPYIFDSKLHLGGDNAAYYLFGMAIEQGAGYTNIHFNPQTPTHHFPPGYSFLISGMLKVFGYDFNPVKILNGVFLLAMAVLFFYMIKSWTGNPHLAFASAALSIFNIHMLEYSTIIMSEVPFLFFFILSLFLVSRLEEMEGSTFYWPTVIAALLTIIFAWYIRSIGLAIIVGVVFYLLLNRKWLLSGVFAGGFYLGILPWQMRSDELGGSGYMAQLLAKDPYDRSKGTVELSDLLERFFSNIHRYLSDEIPSALLSLSQEGRVEGATDGFIFIGLVTVALGITALIKLEKQRWLLIGVLGAFFGVLVLWPENWFGVRFMIPAIPVLFALCMIGAIEWIKLARKGKSQPKWELATVIPILFLFIIPFRLDAFDEMNRKSKRGYPTSYANYFNMGAWTSQNLPKESIIAVRKVDFFYLFSGRYVTGFPNSGSPEDVIERFISNKVTHVVLDQLGYASTFRVVLPAIQQYPDKFKPIHQLKNPDTYLFEFNP